MEYLCYPDPEIFAFPVNIIAGVFLILGIQVLHRYYSHTPLVRWLSGMQASLIVSSSLIFLLIIEGIWAIGLYRSWLFILIELLFLIILGLVILRKGFSFTPRHLLFLLNHAGLWLALGAALLGAPDREEYKMIAVKGQPAYNCIGQDGRLHPLPFTVCLEQFELEYYPQSTAGKVPKRFSSLLTLKSREEEKKQTAEVNHPVSFKGYKLYQDGYDTSRGSDSSYTILLIVRDPWLGVVYTGIFMLLAGALGLMIYGPIKKLNV